jgi:hypothetical protein
MADKRWGLRIKDEETCRKIAELAALLGVTKTEAVNRALRNALARERSKQEGGSRTEPDEVGAENPETRQG